MPWTAVASIRIPSGGFLANVELSNGEVAATYAVQSIDAAEAARLVARLRTLHAAA